MDENLPINVLNPFEDEVISLGTRTALKLIKLGSDELTLYCFYLITSKRQSIALKKRIVTIKATEDYCMDGLNWGKLRFRTTKKNLIDAGLVKNIIKKDDKGKVLGYYIQINFVPMESSSIENHPLDNPPAGRLDQWNDEPPNTVKDKYINTDSSNKNTVTPSISLVSPSPRSKPKANEQEKSSKDGIYPLTALEKWEMAKHLDVPLWVIEEVDKQFWDYIELPKNKKKYKTSYKTIKRWVEMALSKNKYNHCNEVETMELDNNHPDKVAERAYYFGLMRQRGELE